LVHSDRLKHSWEFHSVVNITTFPHSIQSLSSLVRS
jgi:hypothetical protein